MYRHILIPTDGSELARRAVQHGLALAKVVGAKVTALTVEGVFAAKKMSQALTRTLMIRSGPTRLLAPLPMPSRRHTPRSA